MNENRFFQARRSLLLDHCFFGSLVMHLNPKEDAQAKRALWVDGKQVGFNPKSLDEMELAESVGVLAKGVLSCALQHHLRRGPRQQERWQKAVDLVTNPLILDSGLQLPKDAERSRDYEGLSAEEVYTKLEQEEQEQKGKQGPSGQPQQGAGSGSQPSPSGQPQQGSGAPQPGQGQPQTGEVRDLPGEQGQQAQPSEQTAQGEEWKIRMKAALTNALSRGDLPASMKRMVEAELKPRISWRDELRRFFQAIAKDDLSWKRPNRRFVWQGLYLPSVRSERLGPVVVAIDTSGSITAQLLAAFAAEVNAVIADTNPELIHVLFCDAAVQDSREYQAEDAPIDFKSAPGGGGTDFRPVFDWVDKQGISPACLIYLTDMEGTFPQQEPAFPTLWVSVSKRHLSGPFGDCVFLDLSQL